MKKEPSALSPNKNKNLNFYDESEEEDGSEYSYYEE